MIYLDPGIDLRTARIHDLSFVIRDHFRWPISLQATESLEDGGAFQTSSFTMSAHGFTHADAPAHVSVSGDSLDDVPATTWIGGASIVDLIEVKEQGAIDARMLEQAGDHVRQGDIVLLKTNWDLRTSIETAAYWTEAPYITLDGARWLKQRGARCVGFDFPQDRAIGSMLVGSRPPLSAFVTHDELLKHGVGLIEYLRGLGNISNRRVFFVAAPIKLAGADGGPVRALAFEEYRSTYQEGSPQ